MSKVVPTKKLKVFEKQFRIFNPSTVNQNNAEHKKNLQ